MSRAFMFFGVLLVAVTLLPMQPNMAQVAVAAGEIQVLVEAGNVPSSGDTVKHPSIAAFGSTVHLAANPSERAGYWSKTDSSGSWSGRSSLGDATGQPDYATAAVATGADGSVYVVWIDRGRERIFLRRKAPGGDFGERKTVGSTSGFAVFVKVGVTTTGRIFVAWNSDKRMRYRTSTNNGDSWSDTRVLTTGQDTLGMPYIASGPNGALVIAHGTNNGRIYASIWNGSSFETSQVDADGNYSADPSATIAPNGTVYVAWRGVEDGEVWYSERQSNGTWPNSRLARAGSGKGVFGKVVISADQGGNLYAFWITDRTGSKRVYAAFKGAGTNWVGPQLANANGYNLDGVATLTGTAFGNVVYESFDDGVRIRHVLYATEGGNAPAAGSIVVNDNAERTNSRNVNVKLTVTGGGANQYQLSNDGVTFGAYTDIPANSVATWELGAASNNACVERTVFGRLRRSDRPDLQSGIVSDAILLDPGVDARVAVSNPYLSTRSTTLSTDAALMDNGEGGASNGDLRYTREKSYFIEVRGETGECSGLTQLVVGSETPVGIVNNYYGVVRAFSTLSPPAENLISVTVTDGAGYTRTFNQTIYYDAQAPVVTAGTPEVVDGSGQVIANTNSIIVNLNFKDMVITDNLYGQKGEGRSFWGVWVANSRTNLDPANAADEAAIDALNWAPVSIDEYTSSGTNTYTFSTDWSLFSGLTSAQRTTGTYYIYARVLDGAGNASELTLKYEVALNENFQLPEVHLPVVRR